MNWWWTDDEQMMNRWWTDDEQLMNWWWTAGLVWCAKDYHRLPQTAIDWLVLLHWTLKPISGYYYIILYISLTPPTTRAPLAVLKNTLYFAQSMMITLSKLAMLSKHCLLYNTILFTILQLKKSPCIAGPKLIISIFCQIWKSPPDSGDGYGENLTLP